MTVSTCRPGEGRRTGEEFVEDAAEASTSRWPGWRARPGPAPARRTPPYRAGRRQRSSRCPALLAMPKSVILSVPSGASSRLAGFTSRWTIPAAWAASSARAPWSGDVARPARPLGRPGAAHQLRQIRAGHELHHQEHVFAVRADVVRRDDVRVHQPGRRTGPRPGTARPRPSGRRSSRPQQLDRHLAGEHGVLGLPHLTGTTSAQQGQQAVAPCQYLAVHKPHLPQRTATP